MTSFTESTVEEAALAWLGASGRQVAHGPDITPDTPRQLDHENPPLYAGFSWCHCSHDRPHPTAGPHSSPARPQSGRRAHGPALGVNPSTTQRYLGLLADALMVRQLQPWYTNLGKRQVKSPKVYVRDSGLLHQLLGLETEMALLSHPKVGASWEGFVIELVLATQGYDEGLLTEPKGSPG